MKLSTKARYSMRLMMAVAKLGGNDRPVPLEEASRRCNVSTGYLGQLATRLRHAGLLESRPGPGGGFRLAKPGALISLKDIVEPAIGPLAIANCIEGADLCPTSDKCTCRELWTLVNIRVLKELARITLGDLVSKDWPRRLERELTEGAGGA